MVSCFSVEHKDKLEDRLKFVNATIAELNKGLSYYYHKQATGSDVLPEVLRDLHKERLTLEAQLSVLEEFFS